MMSKMLVRRHGATPIEYGLIAALIATTIAAAAFQYYPHIGKFFSPMMTAMSPAVKSSASLTAPSAPVPVYPTFSSWGSDLNNYDSISTFSNMSPYFVYGFTNSSRNVWLTSRDCKSSNLYAPPNNISNQFNPFSNNPSTAPTLSAAQSNFISCLSNGASISIVNNSPFQGYQLPSFLGGISLNPQAEVDIYPQSTYAQSPWLPPQPMPIFQFSQTPWSNSTNFSFSQSQISSAKTACLNLGGNFATNGTNATAMNCYTNPSSNINTIGFPNNIVGSYFSG